MAKNFRIQKENDASKSLVIKLFGDFDASSACELVRLLNEKAPKKRRVRINTDGLRKVNTFGLDVLVPRILWLNRNRLPIEVTGRFKEVFLGE